MAFVTRAALDRAMPHILAAPKTATVADQLCFRPDFNQRTHPDRLRLTRAGGVPGERWMKQPWLRLPDGTPDPRIQVSILGRRVVEAVIGPDMMHPGDTIIADLDTSEANLPAGTLLQAGSAVLCVSDVFNDACVKWKARYGREAYDWISAPGHPPLRLRGILCEIVSDGEVAVGDPIRRLPT